MDLINGSIGFATLQEFYIPNLYRVILTSTHENILLSGMPIKVHGTFQVPWEFKDWHILLSHIPNTYHVVPLARGYLSRIVWVKLHAFDLASVEFKDTLLVINRKDFHFAIVGPADELPRVFRIPVQEGLGG